MKSGFTIIEVLAAVLVLTLGLASSIGIVIYGMGILKLSMARATATATAVTLAIDIDPLEGPQDDLSSGYFNGYYFERSETGVTVASGVISALVTVDIYETFRGRHVCSYSQRVLRQQEWSGP